MCYVYVYVYVYVYIYIYVYVYIYIYIYNTYYTMFATNCLIVMHSACLQASTGYCFRSVIVLADSFFGGGA